MGENDSDNASSGSHTIPTEAIEQVSTVEMNRYSIMQRVQQDMGTSDQTTVRMPAQTARIEDVEDDNKATLQLPAITDQTALLNPDPHLLAALRATSTSMKTLDVIMEPISAISGAITRPLATRMEFEAVIQPNGVIQIPDEYLKSGHARTGMRIKIIAEPA